MKLEVGQKIGIYEVVDNKACNQEIGYQSIGIDRPDYPYPIMMLRSSKKNGLYFLMEYSEVRLVASLRVKAVK